MRQKLLNFMMGRNGPDELNRFLLLLSLVGVLLGRFIPGFPGSLLWLLGILLLAACWFRLLSKNLPQRRLENSRFLQRRYRMRGALQRAKTRWAQRRDYRFFNCPACHTTLRVPRGRGKIRIVCRKCGSSFTRKS